MNPYRKTRNRHNTYFRMRCFLEHVGRCPWKHLNVDSDKENLWIGVTMYPLSSLEKYSRLAYAFVLLGQRSTKRYRAMSQTRHAVYGTSRCDSSVVKEYRIAQRSATYLHHRITQIRTRLYKELPLF